jgi:hypothetical protein
MQPRSRCSRTGLMTQGGHSSAHHCQRPPPNLLSIMPRSNLSRAGPTSFGCRVGCELGPTTLARESKLPKRNFAGSSLEMRHQLSEKLVTRPITSGWTVTRAEPTVGYFAAQSHALAAPDAYLPASSQATCKGISGVLRSRDYRVASERESSAVRISITSEASRLRSNRSVMSFMGRSICVKKAL